MKLYTRVQILLLLCVAGLFAAGTTVTATFTPGTMTGGSPDLPNGTCTIQPAVQTSTTGAYRVSGPPITVSFTAGAFAATLLPTDTSSPSGQYYSVTCGWPAQQVNGRQISAYRWPSPHIWTVPSSPASVDISVVETAVKPTTTLTLVQANFAGSPFVTGTYNVEIASNGSMTLTAALPTNAMTWNGVVMTWAN